MTAEEKEVVQSAQLRLCQASSLAGAIAAAIDAGSDPVRDATAVEGLALFIDIVADQLLAIAQEPVA